MPKFNIGDTVYFVSVGDSFEDFFVDSFVVKDVISIIDSGYATIAYKGSDNISVIESSVYASERDCVQCEFFPKINLLIEDCNGNIDKMKHRIKLLKECKDKYGQYME